MNKKSAVFLDRDGVINQMVYNPEFGFVDSPANPDQFCLLPEVPESIVRLNHLGLLVVVVTNQPGIAKGKFTARLLDAMTQKMEAEIALSGGHLDGVYCCLHHPESVVDELKVKCNCRKPKPGLLLQAAQELNIDLSQSYMVGDGITDIQAGDAVGTTTLFVSSRKCYVCDNLAENNVRPDFIVKDLPEAVEVINRLKHGLLVDAFRFECKL